MILTRSVRKEIVNFNRCHSKECGTQTDFDGEQHVGESYMGNEKQYCVSFIDMVENYFKQQTEKKKTKKYSDDKYLYEENDSCDEEHDEYISSEDNCDEEQSDEEIEEEVNYDKLVFKILKTNTKKRKSNLSEYEKNRSKLSKIENKFLETLNEETRHSHMDYLKMITSIDDQKPMLFKIIDSGLDDYTKSIAIRKLDQLKTMSKTDSEYHKLNNWLTSLLNIPFGLVKSMPVNNNSSCEEINTFINKINTDLNMNVYGHDEAKNQIVRIVAQWVSNPEAKGNVIGIHGSPGVGKTTLIKDGLSKCLDLPFSFIPLGGATDGSFLDGHSYTYEGSLWGKIVDCLMKAKCMNPILYFDELDKISDTSRGHELMNILIHLTDMSQNDNFCDKYFTDVPINLSKCLVIFTYNNDSMINPILKDRLIRIQTKDYSKKDKVDLFQNYLLPKMLTEFNIKKKDVTIDDSEVLYIIEKTDIECGVRNLKRSLELIISNVNLNVLLNNDSNYQYPIKITKKIIDLFIKSSCTNESIHHIYM